jgi:energy-coupling factor transporter transmembrane protein EcfT
MKIKKNVGTTDRIIRLIIGIVALLAITMFQQTILQWILFIVAIVSFFTALVGWCGLYRVFKINTCKVE